MNILKAWDITYIAPMEYFIVTIAPGLTQLFVWHLSALYVQYLVSL